MHSLRLLSVGLFVGGGVVFFLYWEDSAHAYLYVYDLLCPPSFVSSTSSSGPHMRPPERTPRVVKRPVVWGDWVLKPGCCSPAV